MKEKPDYGNIKDEIIRAHIEHEFERKIKLKKCCGYEPVVKFYGCREYFVKCNVCEKRTKLHRHAYEAKQAWNEGERMNQPEARIKYEKCLECNREIAMRYHYDRHLSDWVCYEIPLCDECKSRPRGEATHGND